VPREQLCYLFWPDEPESAARRSLAHLLTHLRRALPEPDLLLTANDQVGLDFGRAWSDTAAFEHLIGTADARLRAGALQQAADLVRGSFLAGFSLPGRPEFDEWAAQERQVWERRYLEVLAALIEHHCAYGDYAAAIAAAQRCLATDELAEEIHRRLIELYALSGDRSAALRQFERCSSILDRELGVSPLPETRAVYERALAGELRVEHTHRNQVDRFESHPTSSPAKAPPLIPASPTPLIGRRHELEAVCALLRRQDVRLLTLSGAGGAGKTRLGIEAAGVLSREFADGAAFVPLAAVRAPELVVAAIAQALGVRADSGPALLEALKSALRSQQILLVLDNFEQLMAAAPLVAELLAAAPSLKALVTSRALLRISGEYAFVVPPLALPSLAAGETAAIELDNLAGYAAVALFLARVRATSPAFQLSEANARDIAAICARLDGLPLAIELAAARMKLLSPRMMLARLDRRLALLTDGPRDLPERQQTLRATIDWSYSLLDVAEQLLLGRLAVFVGGWTLEAAEAVCAGDASWGLGVRVAAPSPHSHSPSPILDGLHVLLDKHLIEQGAGPDGEPRFTMLETIREYAQERLAERGEALVARRAHAEYAAELAERAEVEVRGPDQVAWLDRLVAEEANLRAALAWALDGGDPELGLRLAGSIMLASPATLGHLTAGRGWLERALALTADVTGLPAAAAHARLLYRAKGLIGLGVLAAMQGDYALADAWLIECIAACQAIDEPYLLTLALGYRVMTRALQGDWATAMALQQEQESRSRALGNALLLSMALYGKGRAASEFGDDELARASLAESLRLSKSSGDIGAIALTSTDLGQVLMRQGDLAAARGLMEDALASARVLKEPTRIVQALNNLGELARTLGDLHEAEARYAESLDLCRKQGNKVDAPRLLHNLGRVALHRGDIARARALFCESLELFREIGSRRGMAECFEAFGHAAFAGGRLERAARLWGAAEALREVSRATMWAPDRAEYERDLPALQAQLDAHALSAAWAAGRALTIEQAAAEALSD
jgi:predicted ATPase/DNA-binding SARP family transcriptional activator